MPKIEVSNKDFDLELNEAEGSCSITIKKYEGEAEEVIVPASFGGIPVTAIGDLSFWDCKKIKKIFLPDGIISIGFKAFYGCSALAGINLPESLFSMETFAFNNCQQIVSVSLPKGLVEIGHSVFSGCDRLTEITVDEHNPVFCAVDGVLYDKALSTIIFYPEGKSGGYTIPDSVYTSKNGVFENCKKLTCITFPPSFMGSKVYAFLGSEKLTDITVKEFNPVYAGINGVLFDKTAKTLLKYPQGRETTDYIVPDGVEHIREAAFAECKGLTAIILPEGLMFIEKYAFLDCERLRSVTLPTSLQYVGERAFKNCSNLETIKLSRKTKIGYSALEGFSGRLIYRN